MSKKHKRVASKKQSFQVVDGKPMHIATQWFLIGAVATTAAIKIVEASVDLSLQAMMMNPDMHTSANLWLSMMI